MVDSDRQERVDGRMAATGGSLRSLVHRRSRELLDEILQETLAQSQQAPADSDDLQALLPVVSQYRGQPLSRDPILVDLVNAMLRYVFPREVPPDAMNAVARQVAETLDEDPQARERAQRLWNHLSSMSYERSSPSARHARDL